MDTVTLHVHRFSCGHDAQAKTSSCDPSVSGVGQASRSAADRHQIIAAAGEGGDSGAHEATRRDRTRRSDTFAAPVGVFLICLPVHATCTVQTLGSHELVFACASRPQLKRCTCKVTVSTAPPTGRTGALVSVGVCVRAL